MEFLYDYGLFFAKTSTAVIAFAILIALVASTAVSNKGKKRKGELELTSLSEKYQELKEVMEHQLLTKDEQKQLKKDRKKQQKQEKKEAKKQNEDSPVNGRLFVLEFKGSMDAHEVDGLREEVSAVLAVADKDKDEVLIRLESGGGVVHGYGLAASQLNRIRDAEVPLTACVDKVAASGGYMMACVANKVVAAPFAIIGSIGVIAQIPNFHRLLKKHDIDFEQVTAGEYKRTLTMFGENTEHGREKFKDELEEVHGLFKQFVERFRPELDIASVATGEHWFGIKAHELGLVDELNTSDDYLLSQIEKKDIYKIQYVTRKKLADRVADNVTMVVERGLDKLWQKGRNYYG